MSLIQNLFPELRRAPFYSRAFDVPEFSQLSQLPRPAIDVHEEGDKYIVQAEVAGALKEDLKLEFGGDGGEVLTLSGKIVKTKEFKPEEPREGAGNEKAVEKRSTNTNIWHSERFEGSFARSVRFPTPVDTEKVSAKYENGILEVEVPKRLKKEGSKSIEIA
ncbi:HSP20-like chaperone [Atractiella rhizophila]|nr:HSP20-like chaperone [Atractiella rhizophila]